MPKSLLSHDWGNQHAHRFVSLLRVDADRRPTARDLLNAFEQSTNVVLQNPPTNATLVGLGGSPLARQANGTAMLCSAVPTPMDWPQTVSTAFFQGKPQPTQRNESMQPPQPNPVAIPSPNAPPTVLPGIVPCRCLPMAVAVRRRCRIR